MATPVEVPKLGNTVEECLIAKWRKHKGEQVSAGEVVAEIETDKATFELPAPVGGTLLDTFFPEGALVPVFLVPLGQLLARGLGFHIPVGLATSILLMVPLGMAVYYLVWKYVVGFLNELLELG